MKKQTTQTKLAPWQAFTRVLASVLANVCAVLSALLIPFHILDIYNPQRDFINQSTLPVIKDFSVILPILFILTALLYGLLFVSGAFKRKHFNKKRILMIVMIDVLAFAILALLICGRSCDWLGLDSPDESGITNITPPPAATATPSPTDVPTIDVQASDGEPSLEPTSTPTAGPTVIPGLLGDKYAEKFSPSQPGASITDTVTVTPIPSGYSDSNRAPVRKEGSVEQVYDTTNVVETLADGTQKALLYSYSGDQVAVDVYRYTKGKLEYQLADVYVRNLSNLWAEYSLSFKNNVKTAVYARRANAIVAINTDYFNNANLGGGVVVRNWGYIYPRDLSVTPELKSDLCFLYADGTVECIDYLADSFDFAAIQAKYPYQAFRFGPKLLNNDGTARTSFTDDSIGGENPRTVFGYYEPGHYAFLVVLGTREMDDINGHNLGNGKSPGLTFEDLSKLCVDLGFAMAYNMDGGGSASMYWNETIFGHNDRNNGDTLCVVDPGVIPE